MSVSEPYTHRCTDPTTRSSTTMLAMATCDESDGSNDWLVLTRVSFTTADESKGTPPCESITRMPTPEVISVVCSAGRVVSGFHKSPVRS